MGEEKQRRSRRETRKVKSAEKEKTDYGQMHVRVDTGTCRLMDACIQTVAEAEAGTQ